MARRRDQVFNNNHVCATLFPACSERRNRHRTPHHRSNTSRQKQSSGRAIDRSMRINTRSSLKTSSSSTVARQICLPLFHIYPYKSVSFLIHFKQSIHPYSLIQNTILLSTCVTEEYLLYNFNGSCIGLQLKGVAIAWAG